MSINSIFDKLYRNNKEKIIIKKIINFNYNLFRLANLMQFTFNRYF